MDSLRTRILLALLLAGLIPVMLMLVTTQTLTRRAILVSERDKLSELGDEVCRQVLRILDDATADLASMARSTVLMDEEQSGDKLRAKRDEFRRLTVSYANLRQISLHDARGYYIASDSDEATGKLNEAPEFRKALEGAPGTAVFSRPQWEQIFLADGGIEEVMHITVHMPIADRDGTKPHSVVKARVSFESIWEILDNVRVGETGKFVLVDSAGNRLNDLDRSRVLQKFDEHIPPEFWARNRSGRFRSSADGTEYLFEAKLLPGSLTGVPQDWYLVCHQSIDEVSALVSQSQRYLLLAGLITLLVASVVGFALAGKISLSVKQASLAAQEVAKGDLSATIPDSGFREIRGLAGSFNQMVLELRDHRNRLESLVQSRTQKLRESQADLEDLTAQLRATYESTREAIVVVRPSGQVLAANRRVQEFFGINGATLLVKGLGEGSALRAQLFSTFEDRHGFEGIWQKYTRDPSLLYEEERSLTSPSPMQIAIYSAPVKNSQGNTFARLWMFRDMSAQRRLEQGLQQAQKMEAIGRLSGGVAHDFNNLLTGIIGNLSLGELLGEMPGESAQLVASAKRAAERAAGIVKQLLTFSRQNKMSLKPCSANQLAMEVQEILAPVLDPSISLSLDLDPSNPFMLADGNQIDQVLMNFCVNARDALPDGGRIILSTARVDVDSADMPPQIEREPGAYVRISVKDTGTGMPKAVLDKVFEPFFTTKEQGKGTGLGLATSYGIAQEHGGWIECASEVGKGTTFSINIPSCDKPDKTGTAKVQKVQGGNETVLVVDDEAIVRRVAEGVLKHQGYQVKTAQDGKEALEIVASCGDSISLIMLDLTMPRLSGRETFRELRTGRFPHIPVIICSGYLVEVESFEQEAGAIPEGSVQKPYQVDVLAAEVRRVIDAAAASRA